MCSKETPKYRRCFQKTSSLFMWASMPRREQGIASSRWVPVHLEATALEVQEFFRDQAVGQDQVRQESHCSRKVSSSRPAGAT